MFAKPNQRLLNQTGQFYMSYARDRVSEVQEPSEQNAASSAFSSEVYAEPERVVEREGSTTSASENLGGNVIGEDGFELFDSQAQENAAETGGVGNGDSSGSENVQDSGSGGADWFTDRKEIGSEPEKEQKPSDVTVGQVTQGDIGNCFFVSSLASLASTPEGQQSIRDMVKLNEDGSSTVTFPGDPEHPVVVTQKDVDENLENGNLDKSSDTLMRVQTAFLKYDRADQYGNGINELQKSGMPFFSQILNPGSALHLLTGRDTASQIPGVINSNLNLGGANPENVARFVQQALDSGQPVVAGTAPWADDPIVPTHAYSVLSFDPAANLVTVRNPWGHNNGHGIDHIGDCKNGITNVGDGKLTMSYDTFIQNFSQVDAAGANPTETRLNNLANDAGNILESNANLAGDILNGRYREILPDVSNLLKNYANYAVDVPATAVNELESLVGARLRGTYNVFSSLAHAEMPSLSDINNFALVPEPALDAADALISKVGDVLGSIF